MEKSEILIEAANVERFFPMGMTRVQALHGVSLSVSKGEKLCIMGASGAGKSTLLGLLGGLDKPTSGEIFFKGESLSSMNQSTRTRIRAEEIGFVFQAFHLLRELNVLENVMLPAMSRAGYVGRTKEIRNRAEELLKRVDLINRADHKPLELSGGEQQRVAIARALINQPGLILADEPTGNLDSATGRQVLNQLFDLAKAQSNTLIIVTHNAEIAEMCDRRIELKDGKLT